MKNSLATNINKIIADLDAIKQAIIDQGINVPDNTPTEEYANLIAQIGKGE